MAPEHKFDLTTLVGHFYKLQKSAEDILFPTHDDEPHACITPHGSTARQEEPFGEILQLVLSPSKLRTYSRRSFTRTSFGGVALTLNLMAILTIHVLLT
jgi:hypothetical protein